MHMAYFRKKRRFFDQPFVTENDKIFITDTKRAKKRFLKSPLKNVCFGEEFYHDKIFADKLIMAKLHNTDFLINYLEDMLEEVARFFSQKIPFDEIVVFSENEKIISVALKFARLVTVVGEGEAEGENGAQLRFVKKVRTPPSVVITDCERDLSSVFKVPRINLSPNAQSSIFSVTSESISFSTSLFPFDISADAVSFFIERGEKFEYKLSSCRKKSPMLFTFG